MPGIPSEDACFFGGTPRNYALTLQKGLLTYLKRTISMKAVSDALHDAGVLEEDVSCRTKKWNGIRHYVISRRAIELYCQTKESSKIQ